jgi:hypothetical protein
MGKILNTIAGIGATLVAGFGTHNYIEKSDYMVDGVESVERYSVSGSDTTLVHVRQRHYHPLVIEEEIKQNTIDCQNDIIDMFQNIEGKEDVLVEGNSSYRDHLEFERFELQRYRGFHEQGVNFVNDDVMEIMENRVKYIEETLEKGRIDEYGRVSATDILSYNGEINIHDAETDELNEKRSMENGLGEWNEKTEDYVVERAASMGGVVYTVFGGAHSFRNNIDDWNEANPENKVSLVEITPETYEN